MQDRMISTSMIMFSNLIRLDRTLDATYIVLDLGGGGGQVL